MNGMQINRAICSTAVMLACLCRPASAGVTTDGTVGPAMPLDGPDFDIKAEYGQQEGGNLFHSFGEFSIASGESATFSPPLDPAADPVINVISRVTGGNASTIDGAIVSNIDGASLYLINPSGVMIGENAALDVSGSFYISTADYLVLSDGMRFDAVNPASPVLSTAPVSAFGFLDFSDNPERKSISIQGGALQLAGPSADNPADDEIAVVAGDIRMEDAVLQVPSGRIQLVSVAAQGEAAVAADGTIDSSSFARLGRIDILHTGNFFQRRIANVDTSGDSAGQVYIRAGELVMDFGYIFADNTDGSGGLVDVRTRDRIMLRNEAYITADSLGSGEGGTIIVDTGDLVLQDGGILQVDNYADGVGGKLYVTASGAVLVAGTSPDGLPYRGEVASGLYADSFGNGAGGVIVVDSPQVTIDDGGRIQLNAEFTNGDAGVLELDAGKLLVTDGGIIVTDTFGAGDAGTLDIDVDSLELAEGGSIVANSRGSGDGGVIDIHARDSVEMSGSKTVVRDDGSDLLLRSGIFSSSGGSGDGGSIRLDAGRLVVADGAAIQSGTSGGDATADTRAGDIDITADEVLLSGRGQISTVSENAAAAGTVSLQVSGNLTIDSRDGAVRAGIFSSSVGSGPGGNVDITGGALVMNAGVIDVSSTGSGDAGTVTVQAGSIDMTDGALIRSSVDGDAHGGKVNVVISGDAVLDGQSANGFRTGLYSQTAGTGNGGDISLSAANVYLSDHATITSESLASGDAGNIDVAAASGIELDAASMTTAAASADGGNIKVTADDLVYLHNSSITAAVGGGLGNGGNVSIDPQFVVLSGSTLLASAVGGNGGNITIVADHFIGSADSVLNASSQLGIDGTINILSPDEEVDSNQVELPVVYLDASSLLRDRCSARRRGDQGSFIVAGREALPATPDSSIALLSGLADLSAETGRQADVNIRQQWLADRLAGGLSACSL